MNITLPREVLEQAIDALANDLCYLHICDAHEQSVKMNAAAITALRTALEAPNPPHECKTEAEKTAYAAGWWKALEANRAAPAAREPKS